VPSAFSAYYELEAAEGRQKQSRKRSRKSAPAVPGTARGQTS
jgi:hypothetical protein